MLNFEFQNLRIVKNKWKPNRKSLSMSAGADIIIRNAQIYKSLEEATKDYNNDFFKETFKINSTLAMLASTIIQIERGESHETLLQEAESLSGERAKKFLDLMSNYESTHDENRSARNKLIYTYALKDNNTKLSIVEILEKVPFSPEELDELYSKICPREFSDEINQIIKIKYNNLARRKGYDASCQ